MNAVPLQLPEECPPSSESMFECALALNELPCRRGKCCDEGPCPGHALLYWKACRLARIRAAHEMRVLQLMGARLRAVPHSAQVALLQRLVSAQFARDYDFAVRVWGRACWV